MTRQKEGGRGREKSAENIRCRPRNFEDTTRDRYVQPCKTLYLLYEVSVQISCQDQDTGSTFADHQLVERIREVLNSKRSLRSLCGLPMLLALPVLPVWLACVACVTCGLCGLCAPYAVYVACLRCLRSLRCLCGLPTLPALPTLSALFTLPTLSMWLVYVACAPCAVCVACLRVRAQPRRVLHWFFHTLGANPAGARRARYTNGANPMGYNPR
jgi:hypothetical protein